VQRVMFVCWFHSSLRVSFYGKWKVNCLEIFLFHVSFLNFRRRYKCVLNVSMHASIVTIVLIAWGNLLCSNVNCPG